MKKLALLLIVPLMFTCCTPKEEQVDVKMDYTLDWRTDHLHVFLTYTPTEVDSVTLHYGDISYGGQADIFSCVKNFESEDCRIVTDSAAREVKLYYEGTPVVKLEYDMEYDLEDENLNCPRELFRPNTDKDFLYVQGLNLYLHEKGRNRYNMRVSWLTKPDFPTFCMYNEDGSMEPHTGPQSDFYYKFILGDRELLVDSFELNGTTNYMVTAPRQLVDFNREDIRRFFTDVYTGYEKFWNDTIDYSFTLVMYPFEKIRHDVTGLGLGHAFLCRYNHYADTILTKNRATTVAHEIGHNWISGEQWFGEGFNDLQTWYILTATGLRTIDDYVAEVNDYMAKLHKSKIRNLPNDQISDNFWKLGDYSWIIYWRGAIYGYRLLGQLEAATGDPHIFKTLMTTLGKEHTLGMNREYFIETVSQFMDRDVLETQFEKYIINAETMDLTKTPTLSGSVIKYDKNGAPQIYITDREVFARHFVLE
ncbi:MAG: hypothetical protein IJS02_01920 [Bacteroidales bacterium]|nr:hypothetical protein [Bacteroidales bacterium]